MSEIKWSTGTYKTYVWAMLPSYIQWLSKNRPEVERDEVIAGINFSIILIAACYIEGCLESSISAILENLMPADALSDRLKHEAIEDINRHTGVEKFDSAMRLVSGKSIQQSINNNSLWESIRMLFQFRNVIAHGRKIVHTLRFPEGIGGYWETEFKGNYRNIEDYLLRKELISESLIETNNPWLYFSNEIADHFWELTTSFLRAIEVGLPEDCAKIYSSVVATPNFFSDN